MKLRKTQLRKIIRKVMNESRSFPAYEDQEPKNPYTHGYGGYGGSHSTIFGKIRKHEASDPGVLDMIIDWTHEVESLYKDAFGDFEDRMYIDFDIDHRDPEYKQHEQEWMEEHRADWASRYNGSGASEVIPERVWTSLFDYIIEDFMTPKEFSDKVASSRR